MTNSVSDQLMEDLDALYDFEGSLSDKLRAYFLLLDGSSNLSYSDLLTLVVPPADERSGIFPREIYEA